MLPPQNYLAWKVCVTALHGAAISATVLRVRIRWKYANLWWDDYAAAAITLVDVAFATVFLLTFGTHAGSSTPLNVTDSGFLNFALYHLIFWICWVSLALSIARVFPEGTIARKALIAMAVLFLAFCIFTSTLGPLLCLWSHSGDPPEKMLVAEFKNCQPGTLRHLIAGALTSAVELLSDIMGTIVPLIFLWRISLPPKERRLVHGAISASLLTALCGVVTCAIWFTGADIGKDAQIVINGVHHQKIALSIIVCNFLVVATYWWRKVYRRDRPIPRRYRHNDPNIPTTKISSQSPSFGSGSRSHNAGNRFDSTINPTRSFSPGGSSRLPDDLTFTPITSLSAYFEPCQA